MVKKAKQKENAKRKKAAAKKPVVSAATVNKPVTESGNFDKVYSNQKTSFWKEPVTYLQRRPALVVLILFLILGAGFFAYNQYQIYQEKQDFKQAEVVLDELATDITNQLGEPLNSEKEKYCSYRSIKIGDPGPPACSVSINFIYPTDLFNQSAITEVEELISSNNRINSSGVDMLVGNEYNKNEIASSKMPLENSSLECYMYVSKITLDQNNTRLSLGCRAQDSLSEHFPVKN